MDETTSTIIPPESYAAHLDKLGLMPGGRAKLLYHGPDRRAAEREKERPLVTTDVGDGTIAVWALLSSSRH